MALMGVHTSYASTGRGRGRRFAKSEATVWPKTTEQGCCVHACLGTERWEGCIEFEVLRLLEIWI